MDAQLYWSITSRLAYYDSMRADAPRREAKTKTMKPPRAPLARMPKRTRAVVLTTEDQNA